MFTRARLLNLATGGLLAAVLAGIAACAHLGRWDPALLGILAVLVVGANFVEIELKKISISGDGLGLVIAMALLGPSQAAVLGLLSTAVWLIRAPTRLPLALVGFAGHAGFGLAGGLVMREVGGMLAAAPTDMLFALAVLSGFVVATAINVTLQFATMHVLDGIPFWGSLRTVVAPLLPSEAAMALLAGIIVYAESHLGAVSLALLVALFFLYLHLLRELTLSQQRSDELHVRTEQLAALQVGVLTAMLRTLAMRDHHTARHSAAVARYTRAMAEAAGCTSEVQDLAHTAGLLHDIGKFILPDHILLADTRLNEEDWQLIKMHPYQGAKVVREVEGYGPVADIIWCHHERIDGMGYPRGLSGEDIPLISRMISIADTYDVMTSRDSYRNPVTSAEAVAELRRVSGAQLDGRLVEVFVEVLRKEDLAFQHTDDTDFETELAFERRVRDYASGLKAAA